MPPRTLTLETNLGADVLVPTRVTGDEGTSKVFRFDVTAQTSAGTSIAPKDLLNTSVTLGIKPTGHKQRFVNGIVTGLSRGIATHGDVRVYHLTISPSIWILDRRSGYRIFQKKTISGIAEAVLKDAEITAFEFSLGGTYAERDYCVQYGETDLAFLQRLFAEEGLFFFFKHEQGKHTLVVGDKVAAYADCDEKNVEYSPEASAGADVYSFDMVSTLSDGAWQVQDYNFEAPSQFPKSRVNALTNVVASGVHRVYGVTSPEPAGLSADTMKRLATARVEASAGAYEVARAAGSCATFTPGHKFSMTHDGADAEYVITEIQHEATDDIGGRSGSGTPTYNNSFSCIPAARTALLPLPARKPFVPGPHTAIVVGPAGDEIHTDEHGRIRVQFHWDELGNKDEKSGCFVRVAQSWAGEGWGSMFIPRVGMEVVVQFLEGDPDRPLVTGTVYNATNVPPWGLPDNKEKSGIKTRSSAKGAASNANWLYFDDKKDAEQINIQAEKDFVRTVKNDDTLEVKHDQKRTIKNDRTTTISEGNDTLTIEKGNRDITIKTGTDSLKVTQGTRTVTLDQGDHILKMTSGNQSTTLTSGNQTTTLTGGNQTTTLNSGNLKMSCSAGKITLEALGGITLVCGPSKIEVTSSGVTINGAQVNVKGMAKAEVAGPIVNISADGIANIKGGIVKIN